MVVTKSSVLSSQVVCTLMVLILASCPSKTLSEECEIGDVTEGVNSSNIDRHLSEVWGG